MKSLALVLDRPLLSVSLRAEAGGKALDVPLKEGQAPAEIDPSEQAAADAALAQQRLEEIRQLLNEIKLAVKQHEMTQTNALAELRDSAIKLGLRIARSIVAGAVENSSERLTELIREVIQSKDIKGPISVRLNPLDVERLEAAAADDFPSDSELVFVPDESIAPGNCQLVSTQVTLVSYYEQTFDEIEKRLLEALS